MQILLDDKGEMQSGFFCAPMRIEDLLGKYIKEMVIGDNQRFISLGYGRVNISNMSDKHFKIEDFRKIEYFLDETSLEKLTKETLEIGNEIMNDREEIIKYLNQQDDIDIDVSDLM